MARIGHDPDALEAFYREYVEEIERFVARRVAGVAIYTSTGDNTTSAYAVETDPDGKVSVEITDLTEAGGLEEILRAVGVPAKVSSEPMTTVCAVELEDGDVPEGDLKKTTSSATVDIEMGDGSRPLRYRQLPPFWPSQLNRLRQVGPE